MISLHIEDAGGLGAEGAAWLRAQGARAMAELARRHGASGELRARLVGDAEMCAAHAAHSGDPTTTDVLTFDMGEGGAGVVDADALLCVDEARRQAGARGHSPEAELLLYAVHAALHCLGFDDRDEDGAREMAAEQAGALRAIGLDDLGSGPASGGGG